MPPQSSMRERFIELGADIEHSRWSKWQSYLFSKCIKNEDGSLTIPTTLVERWQKQIDTPYKDLSESEKESDRKEVLAYIPLLDQEIALSNKELCRKLIKDIKEYSISKHYFEYKNRKEYTVSDEIVDSIQEDVIKLIESSSK